MIGRAERGGTDGLQRWHKQNLLKENACFAYKWAINKWKTSKRNFATHRTRARVRKILLLFMESGARAAPVYGGRPVRARARARALSTRDFQNSHFLLYNFQNNQSKSCSAPRVWQVCKSSAQSESMSKSYAQNKFSKQKHVKQHPKTCKTTLWTIWKPSYKIQHIGPNSR